MNHTVHILHHGPHNRYHTCTHNRHSNHGCYGDGGDESRRIEDLCMCRVRQGLEGGDRRALNVLPHAPRSEGVFRPSMDLHIPTLRGRSIFHALLRGA